jgi:hypothetical protein
MKWWQRVAAIIVRAAKNWLDDSQSVERLLAFLDQRLQQCAINKAAAGPEIAYAYQRAAELGLGSGMEKVVAPHPNLPSREQFEAWRQDLPRERVIDRTGLAPGTGLMLLSILDAPGQHRSFLQTELERILRRVEVKRQLALHLPPNDASQNAWMEKHAIAILLSRAAHVFQDLRFLNAALKLNDWAFPSHHRLHQGPQVERYLWSLVEQETSWKAMLG